MRYQEFTITDFFTQIDTEQKAIDLFWKHKCDGTDFTCPNCSHDDYYQLKSRPEVRECPHCGTQTRLRSHTMFENSKVSMLNWARAIFLVMSSKRGCSALEIQRQLSMKSYRTVLGMLHKIRHALGQRDSGYKLKDLLELDSTSFGKKATGNQREVLIAVESREFKDKKGEIKSKAGFAKVEVTKENKDNAENFLNTSVDSRSDIHTDGAMAYSYGIVGMNIESRNTYNDHKINEEWLPWVHKFISNAKRWILGTHHGVSGHYLHLYLHEYTYRFNRRHDGKGLFSRALRACCLANPIKLPALSG